MINTKFSQKTKCAITGALAGIANGFFGGGGGMLMIPLFTRWVKMEERKAFSTSICVILPMCIVSSCIYLIRGNIDMSIAWPYLLGGLVGGSIGGHIFKKIPVNYLRRALGILIIYGGIRSLL